MIRMVCYDISENRPRKRLADYLEQQGFERIQYSIFVGRIRPRQWKKIKKKLTHLFENECLETDRIFSHVIEQDHFKKMTILGEELDISWLLQETKVWFA